MDVKNRFHTASTFFLVRAESLLLAVCLCALLAAFFSEVRWGRFAVAFSLIDLVGYIPGAIAFRRAAGRTSGVVRIPAVYHYLYNVTHSFLFTAAVIGLWFLCLGDVEWAMLAMPVHLLFDRGLFGNVYKPTSLPFEPTAATSGLAAAQLQGGAS
jgi:hypothetical protein